MATLYAKAAGGNWTAAGTWSATSSLGGDSAGPPTAADNTIFDANSGNVTIDSGAVARSIDCTGYVGTLTHTAAVTLTLGDGTAGAGNIALKFVAGMTYTLGNATTSAISFVSTSATVQTITTGGKTLGNWTVNGASSSYQLADSNTTSSTATVTLTTGTLDTNSQTCSWGLFISNSSSTRTITLGSSTITLSQNSGWNTSTITGLTMTANTGTISLTAVAPSFNSATFNFNGASISMPSGGIFFLAGGSTTVANFTYTGTAVKTGLVQIQSTATLTVTGTFTVNGNSAVNRVYIVGATLGTARTISAATVSVSNVDFADIIAAGAGNWNLAAITGNSGDGGGNTGITFTTPATQTHTASAGGNWSDITKWTSRVPLPQDDVVIDSNTTGTITADMPRLGKNINFTGFAGTAAFSSTANAAHGSWTNDASMTISGTQVLTFAGRSSYTITSAGKTFTQALTFGAPTGTYTLADTLTTNGGINVNIGTFTTNNITVNCATFTGTGASSTINLGTSTINLTTTSTANVFVRTSAAVFTAGAATINITTASANTRSFSVGGTALSNTTINYTLSGSTGALGLGIAGTSSTTFGTLNFSDASNARTLIMPVGVTTTFTNSFNVQGTAGKLMSITSFTPGSTATISKSSGFVSCDYLSIQDSTATGGASWYAGANSTNVSNNSGWFFTPPNTGAFLDFC